MSLCTLEHSVIICSAAVSGFEKGQRLQKAQELIAGTRQCQLEPDVITYSAAIREESSDLIGPWSSSRIVASIER